MTNKPKTMTTRSSVRVDATAGRKIIADFTAGRVEQAVRQLVLITGNREWLRSANAMKGHKGRDAYARIQNADLLFNLVMRGSERDAVTMIMLQSLVLNVVRDIPWAKEVAPVLLTQGHIAVTYQEENSEEKEVIATIHHEVASLTAYWDASQATYNRMEALLGEEATEAAMRQSVDQVPRSIATGVLILYFKTLGTYRSLILDEGGTNDERFLEAAIILFQRCGEALDMLEHHKPTHRSEDQIEADYCRAIIEDIPFELLRLAQPLDDSVN